MPRKYMIISRAIGPIAPGFVTMGVAMSRKDAHVIKKVIAKILPDSRPHVYLDDPNWLLGQSDNITPRIALDRQTR